jgi:DNA-binding transcriptional LysR family regulator
MVSAGLGCGLVPRLAVEAEAGTARLQGLRFLPIADQPPRLVGLAWRRDRGGDEVIERVARLALHAAGGANARPPLSAHG